MSTQARSQATNWPDSIFDGHCHRMCRWRCMCSGLVRTHARAGPKSDPGSADTSCRAGGLGFSEIEPDCAYEHSIYRTGYRYNGQSIGHSIDSDGLSYSVGSTLVQFAGHSWNLLIRYAEINRVGSAELPNGVSSVPIDVQSIQLSHSRNTRIGSLTAGIGLSHSSNEVPGFDSFQVSGFIRWMR